MPIDIPGFEFNIPHDQYNVAMEVKNLRLVIVDTDHSRQSSLMMDKCTGSGYFRLVEICESPIRAQELMDNGDADLILNISEGFGNFIDCGAARLDELPLSIKVNTVNGTRASIGLQYLNACVTAFISPAVSPSSGAALAQDSIDTVETYRYNPRQDYKLFMVPALIVIAITMMCGFMPALNIVSEKSVSRYLTIATMFSRQCS